MKHLLFFVSSLATVVYAFYLRNTVGNAGVFSFLAVPAIFYLMISISDIYNSIKGRNY